MSKKYNEIVICKSNFNSNEEFENAIKRAVMVLLENNYIMTIEYDEPGLGIVWIKYEDSDESLGGSYPVWLSPEEYDSIIWDTEREVTKEGE